MRRFSQKLLLLPLAVVVLVSLATVNQGSPASVGDPERPRVRLIATGGTISARTDGSRLTAAELVGSVPELHDYVRPEWEQFSNVASTALTLEQWVQLAHRINRLFEHDADLQGIVVATGTDTLEELGYFLHLTVESPRPVVLVGAMRTPGAADADGGPNLLSAFRTAADERARGKGVLVVMNGTIHSARDVVKTDAQRLDAFESRQHGALGVVDTQHVRFNRAPSRRHTTQSEFDVDGVATLPRVDILLFYQGATPDLIESAIDLGARGVVLAVAGADTTAGSLGPGMAAAARRHVPVVLSTRTRGGRIRPPVGDAEPAKFIAADDLPPLKARILLALALTRNPTEDGIRRMFREY